jgi:hypothetical protein
MPEPSSEKENVLQGKYGIRPPGGLDHTIRSEIQCPPVTMRQHLSSFAHLLSVQVFKDDIAH